MRLPRCFSSVCGTVLTRPLRTSDALRLLCGALQLPLSEKANVALRRNIERLMAEKAGLDKAHACFAEIAQGKPDSDISAETLTVVQFARSLLKHVFSEEEVIETWLVELTAGRFMP